MTDETPITKPAKRGRPRKQKVSEEAAKLFPDYIPSDQRGNQLEHDVDDIFANLELPAYEEESEVEETPSYFAKRDEEETTRSPDIYDNLVEGHKTITSPGLDKEALDGMIRAEEVAADIIRTKGRFIEGVDNAKPGVTFRGPDESISENLLDGIDYPDAANPQQFIEKPKHQMRADGVTLRGVLDTGAGAQEAESEDRVNSRDDPSSQNFMVCVNRDCRYREHCMRYRMSNQRAMKTVFYPEDCRRDGIYMNIEHTDFTAYDPFTVLESKSTPSF